MAWLSIPSARYKHDEVRRQSSLGQVLEGIWMSSDYPLLSTWLASGLVAAASWQWARFMAVGAMELL